MRKVLACKANNVSNSDELFDWIQKKYCFVDLNKQIPKDKVLVIPYVIVTDGHDVFTPITSAGVVDMGLSMLIYKPPGIHGIRTRSKFKKFTRRGIIGNFLKVFKESEVLEKTGDGRQPVPMGKEHIELRESNHAVRSMSANEIMPIYFLMLPNYAPIRLPEVNNIAAFAPLTIGSLKHNMLALMRMSTIARSVITLILKKEIPIPKRENSSFFNDEVIL
jgi:hypothetical protein